MKKLLVGAATLSAALNAIAGDMTINGGTVNGMTKYFASGNITVDGTEVQSGGTLELNALGNIFLEPGTKVYLGASLVVSQQDSDSDGLHDNWETHYLGDTSGTAAGDGDNDGSSNLNEFDQGTYPDNPDSDNDGYIDGVELTEGTDGMDAADNPGPADTAAPSTPGGLAEVSKTDLTATFSWNASTDEIGVVGYVIFRGGTEVGQTGALEYTDTGLQSNTAYTYTVKAKDQAGNFSAASSALNITTTNVDQDGDGMEDAWEITHFGSTNQDGTADFDNDGVNDLNEFLQGGDPTKIEAADTNNDVDLQVVTEGE